MLACFDPILLQPFGGAGARSVIVDRLLPKCEPVTQGPGRGLWTLSLPDRRAALRRLATRDRMRQALHANSDRLQVPQQLMFERLVNEEQASLGEMFREDLVALINVRDWVEGILRRPPGQG